MSPTWPCGVRIPRRLNTGTGRALNSCAVVSLASGAVQSSLCRALFPSPDANHRPYLPTTTKLPQPQKEPVVCECVSGREREKERNRERENCNRLVCVYIYTGVPCIIICALCCSRCTSAKCMCRRSCRFTETTRRFGSGWGVREEVVVVEKVEEGGAPGLEQQDP